MILAMIVAIDQNNGIGKNGDQLAYISADLKRFKELTTGHTIIMGRKTFEALPKGALPNRRNVVITRQKDYKATGAEVVKSMVEAISLCSDDQKVFVIGGGEVYKAFLHEADELYLTEIHHSFDGVDVFFPEYKSLGWKETFRQDNMIDEKTGLTYSYINLKSFGRFDCV
ncbi:dihydrofolate reductase [Carboxylicivirga caseinilyticus]|uniref:dihydrofolate reductase n=1 Tax=Carboxylicivirga caseinilyticus TaxID=3417572 RepID=UPI003D32FF82|nr:dihydrofolate reductase [Marinilabiliaceae bacterium A049]